MTAGAGGAIPVERFRAAFLALLEETFERPHGIFLDKDTSLLQTLARLSAADASWSVSPGRPTVAAQVEHCRFYLEVLEKYMRGEAVGPVDWKEIWRTVREVDEAAWDSARVRLRTTYDRVSTRLRAIVAWDGEHDVDGALAVLVHTAYHLGQIQLVARAAAQRNA